MPVDPFPIEEGEDIDVDPYNYLVSAANERGFGVNEIHNREDGDDVTHYDGGTDKDGIRSPCRDDGAFDLLDDNYFVNELLFPGANFAGLSTTNPGIGALGLIGSHGGFANEAEIRQAAGISPDFSIPLPGPIDIMVGEDLDPETLNEIYNFYKACTWFESGISEWSEVEKVDPDGPDIFRFTLNIDTPHRWKAFVFDHHPRDAANPPETTGTLIPLGSGDGPGSCSIIKDHTVVNDTQGGDLIVFFYPHYAYCP